VKSSFTVPANRSISGRVNAPNPATAVVRLVEVGRDVRASDEGLFVFRNLAPGRYTVEVTMKGKRARREVDVPNGPARVSGIDFDMP
jgi:hypothetical protein